MSAGIIDIDYVKYACTCGLLKTLQQLYFCRYCSELRCSFCVSHEVDSHFCGKCCENLPSPEARVKKNRCVNCFICPSCHHELSTRIASKQPATPEEAKATKRTYYLSCLCCRWSSRDIGLPDQTSATGSWPKRKTFMQDKEFFKRKQKEKIISYTDKTGITAASLRKRIGLPEDKPILKLKNAVKMVTPSIAQEDIDDFDEEVLTKSINLLEITSIDQRLLQPDVQPVEMNMIFPVQKMLSIKRSLRCRSCEHNVSKPEYNPNSIKFKIQLFAFYHIPEIRIVTVQPLRAGVPAELLIKFTNPTQHQTTISFLPFDTPIEIKESTAEVGGSKGEDDTSDLDKSLPLMKVIPSGAKVMALVDSHLNMSRSSARMVTPRPLDVSINCDVEIPSSTFILPPRDDAAEYDDFNEAHNIQDDKKLVIWRKSNKAFIKLIVTPKEDTSIGTVITAGFTMSHLYTNTITSVAENKKPQKFNHNIKLILDLGKSVGSE
ncbi:hypothetical protein HHI36_012909 [Cryptolaemus montrouzieri]|uniref:Dynactin subunit 4 n=1 Tax=Cryptolaemus montrouzieri TaxID=559131 RepID=A0ABD2NFJ8_9CUCU